MPVLGQPPAPRQSALSAATGVDALSLPTLALPAVDAEPMEAAPLRIVIIGGGFAGISCARQLVRRAPRGSCEIVLFAHHNAMVFYPLLAEVAGAAISPSAVSVPIRQMLPEIVSRTEAVWDVDVEGKRLEFLGEDGTVRGLSFDHCVIACGSVVHLHQVPGMADHAFPLKSVADALDLRHHVMQQMEKAEVCDDPERRRWYLSIVVVGGGFSGVEVAGELNDLLRESATFYNNFGADGCTVTLVHSHDEILPEVSPALRTFAHRHMERAGIRVVTQARVVSATADGVELNDGRVLRAATIVCTIGTTMPELVRRLDVPKDRGRLCTDPDMRLRGTASVWAIGDCARIVNAHDGTLCPPTGQFADRQGRQVADNMLRTLRGEPTQPFRFRPLGQLCGIGGKKAVAEILGVRLAGFPAWWLWRTVYLLKMPSWSRRIKLAFDWTWELFFPRDLAHPHTAPTERIHRAHFRRGDLIMREGDPATDLYMIEAGTVEIVRRSTVGGGERVVATVGPGEFFGERALLEGAKRSATARATSEVEVVVMGRDLFSELSASLAPFRSVMAQALRWRQPRTNPLLSEAWDRLVQEPVSRFQEPPPEPTLSPTDTFATAIALLDDHRLEQVPVLTPQGELRGLVGRTELFDALSRGATADAPVAGLMRTTVLTATPQDFCLTIAEAMHKEDADWVPVVASKENRRLVGVVRSERLLRYIVETLSNGRPERRTSVGHGVDGQ
ncbi:MAG: FAD-dependent oxidoreductase [Nitrospiraceae bacterium]